MERPTRCYIRQEWYEAASYLPIDERCLFYECLLSYAYYGKVKDTVPPQIRGMFEMCRTSIDNDCARYTSKVVANRQNGSAGGRPQRGITQKNPTEPNETQKGIQLHIHNTITDYLSTIGEKERDFLILLELFGRGCAAPIEERNKLVDYYTARGWVDKGGNKIKDPGALARVWKCDNTSVYYKNIRKKWVEFCKTVAHQGEDIIITDFVRMEQKEQQLYIFCKSEKLPKKLEEGYLQPLQAMVRVWKAKTITYKIQSNTEEI